jgi:hypothetical protein
VPGVLFAHGHWADGRLHIESDAEVKKWLDLKGETRPETARYFMQALPAQMARMGCVVFQYDMVGVGDSLQLPHREGFKDVDAELWLQSFMGLQTWNSVRALDFLLSLPDVDPARIGVTGASGGGTQTFMLCAVDDRLAAAFPAVMVSTAMQGGCVCENCSYLRVGTGNIELAALFAPKPLGMSGADDWTKEIETKGLPELKTLYKMYGVPNNVMAKAYLQFPHNYNQVSRELMYNFFNKHLKLGQPEPIKEQPFVPVPPKELSVFDAEHPLPSDAGGGGSLRRYLIEQAEKQMQTLVPRDKQGLQKFRAVLGPALRSMIVDELPASGNKDVQQSPVPGAIAQRGGVWVFQSTLSRSDQGERSPLALLLPKMKAWQNQLVVWVHPDGLKSLWDGDKLAPAAQQIIDAGKGILAIEVLRTGAAAQDKRPTTNLKVAAYPFAGYYYGYNRALVADRVHDILSAVRYARTSLAPGSGSVDLVGFGEAGPWVLLARGLCGDAVARTAADMNGFRFEQVHDLDHPMMLPGALRYGGLPALAALAAPHELYLHNTRGTGPATFLDAAYQAAGQPNHLVQLPQRSESSAVVQWLLRK